MTDPRTDTADAADASDAAGASDPRTDTADAAHGADPAHTPRPPGMADFREAVGAWDRGGPAEPARELAERLGIRVAVLLEGPSDLAAVEALAVRRGRDLAAEGVCALPMGGAMNAGRFARLLGPPGLGLRLTGLCDERELPYYSRGLARAGAAADGLFVCAADLEDELVRALGPPHVAELARAEGDHRALRTFLNQPAQQGRTAQQQYRRFLGTTSGRKIRYGRVLVEALDPDRVPAPLAGLLTAL